METLITNDIKISAESFFQDKHSEPLNGKYLFIYNIYIENTGVETVQLLKRHWYIFDSLNGLIEVEGEGVVGKKPILNPGESHSYTSWCPLSSEIGRMEGVFTMLNVRTGVEFEVIIPSFQLISEAKFN
jgi:ApaG protein